MYYCYVMRFFFREFYFLWLYWDRFSKEKKKVNHRPKKKLKGTVIGTGENMSQPWSVIQQMERIVGFEKIQKQT